MIIFSHFLFQQVKLNFYQLVHPTIQSL
jgi:hypothetical protein